LDRSLDGEGGGAQREFGSSHLARSRAPAAPGSSVQVFQRPALCRQIARHRRLYVDPPAHAIVLSLDEKSQIQALERTQPGLPLKKGRAGTMTHDYKRHGTTTLFAAMNVLDGAVIGRNMQRHRQQEFIRFLNVIEKQVPAGKAIHAIVDNYATHKHLNVRRWLERDPRWTFHFTPTSASWLNAIEGFFATLTKRRLKRGVFLIRRRPPSRHQPLPRRGPPRH
jgi:transposase